MGIAHGRADILVAEQFLDFPQILSHLVEEDRGRGVAQPMRGDLPYPEGSTGGPQPQIERPVGKRRARIWGPTIIGTKTYARPPNALLTAYQSGLSARRRAFRRGASRRRLATSHSLRHMLFSLL